VLFPTLTFALFFALVLTVGWWLRPQLLRWKCFMLAASYVFYGWWDWRFLVLLAGVQGFTTFAGYAIAGSPSDQQRKLRTRIAVCVLLGTLGVFKYYDFFVENLLDLLRPLGLAPTTLLVQISLPVGISFFTFCAVSYVVDVGRRDIEPAPLLDIALYLAFFPHLVAGPIVRASEFLPEIGPWPEGRRVDATRGARLVARGLFKKVVIANVLAQTLVDPVFAAPKAHGNGDLLLAVYGYAVQIYADFSGYTDVAIGVALLLGIRFPDNFNRPYVAASLQEFWRRWHMTLSRWLRDYLYIPLGGNRRGDAATHRNLVITMALGGLWHGASWNFVIWGLLHGFGLLGERLLVARRVPNSGHGPFANSWLSRLAVFHFVCLGWIFFRAETLGNAWQVIWRIVTVWQLPEVVGAAAVVALVVGLGAQFFPTRTARQLEMLASRLPPAVQAMGFSVVLLGLDILGPQGVAPFIYFQF
jgi:D-alanyl-lipoteichoic acid acyltransferase DltB (MBOAT superfamily)